VSEPGEEHELQRAVTSLLQRTATLGEAVPFDLTVAEVEKASRPAVWRRARRPALVVAIVAASIAAIVVPLAVNHGRTTTRHPAAPKSPLSVERVYPPALNGLDDVFCSSTSDCLALGGTSSSGTVVMTSTDGGASWSTKATLPDVEALVGLSCVSVSDCVAVGSSGPWGTSAAIVVTTDGGARWNAEKVPSSVQSLTAVSCSSASHCVAVGDRPGRSSRLGNQSLPVILLTRNSGATWTSTAVPEGVASLDGVSCPSANNCMAVGKTTVGSDTRQPFFPIAGALIVTANGGATWAVAALPQSVINLTAISCPTTTNCVAAGSTFREVVKPRGTVTMPALMSTTNGGGSWQVTAAPGAPSLVAMFCASSSDCMAVGSGKSTGAAVSTTNGGATWKADIVPPRQQGLSAVSCASTTSCVAVGSTPTNIGDVIATTNGGGTWVVRAVPGGLEVLRAIACPSTSECIAVGDWVDGAGAIVLTTNGGSTWTAETAPGGVGLRAVACPSTRDCVAVGNTDDAGSNGVGGIVTTRDGGVTWQLRPLAARTMSLTGVSCASPGDCVAVGFGDSWPGVIVGTSDGGATWKTETAPSVRGGERLSGVSCSSARDCVAVGEGYAFVTSNGGHTWEITLRMTDNAGLAAVSCPSTSHCTAVGTLTPGVHNGAGVFTTNNGGTSWVTKLVIPNALSSLDAVSCASTTDCVAVGSEGRNGGLVLTTTNGGVSWITAPAPVSEVDGVSSPSRGYVEAVGSAPIGVVLLGERPAGS